MPLQNRARAFMVIPKAGRNCLEAESTCGVQYFGTGGKAGKIKE